MFIALFCCLVAIGVLTVCVNVLFSRVRELREAMEAGWRLHDHKTHRCEDIAFALLRELGFRYRITPEHGELILAEECERATTTAEKMEDLNA